MSKQKQKDWVAKLHDSKGLPKVEKITGKRRAHYNSERQKTYSPRLRKSSDRHSPETF